MPHITVSFNFEQIVLEGVVSGAGQIAVDEVLLQKGECYGRCIVIN